MMERTYHRLGEPGGPGCRVGVVPVQVRSTDGATIHGSVLDGGAKASELELLRTVALGLGIRWGHDDFGWWAMVPHSPSSQFAEASPPQPPVTGHALYREDDNGARFLIAIFDTEADARQRADQLAYGGHKQYYYIEPVADNSADA